MATRTPTRSAEQIYYPESDGKPMAETDVHRQAMSDTIAVLTTFFRSRPDVYVSGNLLFYYEEGDPSKVVAPDTFVVFGVPKGLRRTYKLWEERQAPAVVIEFTSRKTARQDRGSKRMLYLSLGVQEYYLFDPLEEYLDPPLQGFRLVEDDYVPIPADHVGALESAALGLRLQREGARLRLIDVASGERLLWPDEEAEARRAAEAELERLRSELARLRDGT
jgi:Uma2 family endonuclease